MVAMGPIKKRTTKVRHNAEQEFKSIIHHISDVIAARRRQVVIAAVATAAVLALVVGYSLVQASRERAAGVLLAGASEALQPATGGAPDRTKALEQFRDIAARYGKTMSGALARFFAANILVDLARRDEALAEYRMVVQGQPSRSVLAGLAYQRIGYLSLAGGKQDEALQAFERAESILGTGVATRELAKLYEGMGKQDKAQGKYQELVEKAPGTAWAVEARTKLPQPILHTTPAGTVKP